MGILTKLKELLTGPPPQPAHPAEGDGPSEPASASRRPVVTPGQTPTPTPDPGPPVPTPDPEPPAPKP